MKFVIPTSVMRVMLATAIAASLSACSDAALTQGASAPEASATASVEANTVTGRVTDAAGNPIAGVEVFADHTLLYDANLLARTDADGYYRIDLGAVSPSSWTVGAYLTRDFHGTKYEMRLHPENPDPFTGHDGAVRNLHWLLTGEDGNGGALGAQGYVYQEGGFVEPNELRIDLTPIELIDGTRGGETVTRIPVGSTLYDVAIGRYTVVVRHESPDGRVTVLPVRERFGGDFADSIETSGRGSRDGNYLLELEVQAPPME